jgi:hypothetical protein
MAPMDPQYVSALREAKSLLDDGVFSQKEFEEEKQILKERFHVSQPGVSPAAPAPALFHVSQPGVSPAAPAAAPAPRKGMSDSECRHPLTGRYLIDYRKCSKCPLDTCFLHKSQFSPQQEKKDAKIRLCLQHEGSQGQSRGSSTFQTPTRAARRELGTQMSLCSPRGQRAAVDALDIPSLVDNLGGGSIPAVIHTPSSTSVARVLDASGTTGNIVPGVRTGGSLGPSVAGNMFLGSAGFPLSVPYSYAIPMSNISQVPRSLPVCSVVDDTARSTTTVRMRLPLTQGDVQILDVVDEDVAVLDVCHAAGCGLTSSTMRKCQHCKKFVYCCKTCAKQCPCLQNAHGVSARSRIEDLLNPVVVLSSSTPVPETNAVSCPYCGSEMDVHMGTCSFCYEQYCSRYCIPTFLGMTCVPVPVFRLHLFFSKSLCDLPVCALCTC